jgi:hypothetical protein
MSQETFSLNWKTYEAHIQKSFQNLLNEHVFSDVTLVCDDQTQLQAHKIVLSACSPVLRKILLNNPHQHPLIYLRGVKQQEMQAILQFMYLGEANIFQGRINQFMIIAKEFELKELSKECLDEEEESDSFDIVDHLIGKDIRKAEEELQGEDIEKLTMLDKNRIDTNTMGELGNLDVGACEYVVKNVKTKIEPLVKQEGDFFLL